MNSPLYFPKHEADETSFKQDGLEILPFYDRNGEPIFSDIHLAQFFRRIVFEDTLHKVFHDGSIQNTRDFISFVKKNDHEIFFIKSDGEDAGFFWLTKFSQKSAFVAYCFYKKFWGKKTLNISKLCIKYIFHKKDYRGDYILDVLLGLTPANNKLALKLLIKNGMTVLGTIPKILFSFTDCRTIDGILSYKLRDRKDKTFSLSSLLLFWGGSDN